MILAIIPTLLIASCDAKKEQYRVAMDGAEYGVRIEVLLAGGGSAVMICPRFAARPTGSYGCYLDKASKANKEGK